MKAINLKVHYGVNKFYSIVKDLRHERPDLSFKGLCSYAAWLLNDPTKENII